MDAQFQRQTDKPLFPAVFWNRPTMKSRGGRLLIVGGHKNQFNEVQIAYQSAEAAGIGECTVVMPDSLRKLVGETGYTTFVPSSASGSLGKAATGEISQLAKDADATLVGLNLTNNSETGIMVESLVRQADNRLVYTEETIEILKFNPDLITGNPNGLVVATMNGIVALANNHKIPLAMRPGAGVVGKIEILNQLVSISRCAYVVFDREIIIAAGGEISLTPLSEPLSAYSAVVTSVCATFWLQNPDKTFHGLTSAAFVLAKASNQDSSSSQLVKSVRQAIIEME